MELHPGGSGGALSYCMKGEAAGAPPPPPFLGVGGWAGALHLAVEVIVPQMAWSDLVGGGGGGSKRGRFRERGGDLRAGHVHGGCRRRATAVEVYTCRGQAPTCVWVQARAQVHRTVPQALWYRVRFDSRWADAQPPQPALRPAGDTPRVNRGPPPKRKAQRP